VTRQNRHFLVKFYWLHEQLAQDMLIAGWIPTNQQLADLLTKPPSPQMLKFFCSSIGLGWLSYICISDGFLTCFLALVSPILVLTRQRGVLWPGVTWWRAAPICRQTLSHSNTVCIQQQVMSPQRLILLSKSSCLFKELIYYRLSLKGSQLDQPPYWCLIKSDQSLSLRKFAQRIYLALYRSHPLANP
jgi:hypothetical protein